MATVDCLSSGELFSECLDSQRLSLGGRCYFGIDLLLEVLREPLGLFLIGLMIGLDFAQLLSETLDFAS